MPQETIEQTVPAQAPAQEQAPAPAPAPVDNDPFAVDEAQFASLSPEQRAALDPVMSKWRDTARQALEKEKKTYEPHMKRSQALEGLVKDPRFVKWYQETTQGNKGQETKAPAQVASPEEWSAALTQMANGDPAAWQNLNQKMLSSWAQPTIEGIQQKQNYLEQSMEMTKLFADHADAKDLDQIGREEDPTSPSLLELCLHVVKERNHGTMEQAYAVARQVAKSMENKGKRAAMGMVQEKKGSVTETPPKTGAADGIIYVDSMEEAMTQNIEAAMDGRKVKYAVKK